MRVPLVLCVVASGVIVSSCGSITPLTPTTPSAVITAPAASSPRSPVSATRAMPIRGLVQPLSAYASPCWADRYACEVFDFSTQQEGPISVTLSWNGEPRALRVQLYWADGQLAHEDIGRDASQISFTRPRMEAGGYRLRVVSLEPQNAIPFTLTISY
jgi:hypothetical protein